MTRRRLAARGFSLVELMVGVALTMVIALALMTLMANVSRNNTEMTRTNSVIENGRFTLQLLEADLLQGGFWAGYTPRFDDTTLTAAPTDFPATVPDPCPNDGSAWTQPATWTAEYKAQLIAIPVQVYNVGSTGDSPVCKGTSGLQGPLYTNVQPYTDVVVVRHAAPCVASSTASDTDCQTVTDALYFQYSRCDNTYKLSTVDGDFTGTKGNCTTAADKYRFVSTLYWVRSYFSTAGDGIPTLVRTRFQLSGGEMKHTNTETLVDGIQAFRVQLGVDKVSKPTTSGGTGNTLSASSFAAVPCFNSTCGTYTNTYTPYNRGDGNADTYLTCATGTGASACYDGTDATSLGQSAFNLANTVAVKLFVLARASTTTPGFTDSKVYCMTGGSCTTTAITCGATNNMTTIYGPYCDGYKRHTYTQTVRLNNISMRREVPNAW
jgi:type IV pilus assembly protein PilW